MDILNVGPFVKRLTYDSCAQLILKINSPPGEMSENGHVSESRETSLKSINSTLWPVRALLLSIHESLQWCTEGSLWRTARSVI